MNHASGSRFFVPGCRFIVPRAAGKQSLSLQADLVPDAYCLWTGTSFALPSPTGLMPGHSDSFLLLICYFLPVPSYLLPFGAVFLWKKT